MEFVQPFKLYLLFLLLWGTQNSSCQDSWKQYGVLTMVISNEEEHSKNKRPLWSFFYIYVDGEESLLKAPKKSKGKVYYQHNIKKGSKEIVLYSIFGKAIPLTIDPLFRDTLIELDSLFFQHYQITTAPILHQSLTIGEELRLLFPPQKNNSYFPIHLLHVKAIAKDSIRITMNRTEEDSLLGIVFSMAEWKDFINKAQRNTHPRKKQEGGFILEKQTNLQQYGIKKSFLKDFFQLITKKIKASQLPKKEVIEIQSNRSYWVH